jgi:DNA-binding CsgD family transcriptional regulator
MVRTYKRKGPRPWRDKDKRMAAAVRLRAEGKSLREIAAVLRVSPQTIMRDLQRYDEKSREQAAVFQNVFQLPVPSRPQGGEMEHPHGTPGDAPIALNARRK